MDYETNKNIKNISQSINWNEKISVLLEGKNEKIEEMLKSISANMSSKEDLALVEKKSVRKTNILLSVVIFEAILIGIQFII
jgi:hypothetical protein